MYLTDNSGSLDHDLGFSDRDFNLSDRDSNLLDRDLNLLDGVSLILNYYYVRNMCLGDAPGAAPSKDVLLRYL